MSIDLAALREFADLPSWTDEDGHAALLALPALLAEVENLRCTTEADLEYQRRLEARLAAVEALADEWQRELDEYRIRDENARYCWATAAREVRAALAAPTDTTKEN
ncbi:hypothetical protein [Pseudactinotalea sp. Z1732]|uniref:hypothetical protein n=1 Tax=Micrococcales TaxID=85006 RepID=UPI003C7BF6A1